MSGVASAPQPWWSIHAFAREVFLRLPLDARMRCREVSPAWKAYLDGERALWQHLDLSDGSGVSSPVSDSMLRAACARAGGSLLSLDVAHARVSTPPGAKVTLPALLSVLRASAASLQRVRVGHLWLKYSEDPWVGFAAAFANYLPGVADLERIGRAAPGAVLEAGLQCFLSDHALTPYNEEGPPQHIGATLDKTVAVLHRQAPFAQLRLQTLELSYFFTAGQRQRDSAAANAEFFGHLTAHDSLERVRLHLWHLYDHGGAFPLSLTAFVDACIALPYLKHVALANVRIPRAPLPQLTRLLSECRALCSFELLVPGFNDTELDFVTGPDVGAFCDALRGSRLDSLRLKFGRRATTDTEQFMDAAAGQLVLAAARDCATLRTLRINNVLHTLRQ